MQRKVLGLLLVNVLLVALSYIILNISVDERQVNESSRANQTGNRSLVWSWL